MGAYLPLPCRGVVGARTLARRVEVHVLLQQLLNEHQHQHRPHGDLLAVHGGADTALLKDSLPIVRHVVLRAGGGAGIAVKADGGAREDEPAHDAAKRLRVALLYLRGFLHHIRHAFAHERDDVMAVMLPVYYPCQLPVVEAGELADKVAEARDGHSVGRGLEYIRVADDDLGAVGGHGGLEVVDVHDADGGGKAVHRRAGGDGEARQPELEAGIARHVGYRPRAHADDEVAVVRLIYHDLAERRLVKAEVRERMLRRGDARRLHKLHAARARDLVGYLIAEDERMGVAQALHIVRQTLDRARAYLHALYGHIMRPSTVALQLCVEVF